MRLKISGELRRMMALDILERRHRDTIRSALTKRLVLEQILILSKSQVKGIDMLDGMAVCDRTLIWTPIGQRFVACLRAAMGPVLLAMFGFISALLGTTAVIE
ncbi:hypothetical protein F4818DRAFT_443973 [Hypoxylon cercidicola]|nr:hypothetical protein F4818DRAFT_443973 [Hypoxylon cercidicola]